MQSYIPANKPTICQPYFHSPLSTYITTNGLCWIASRQVKVKTPVLQS